MADIVTGKVFVDGEKGITAAKLNQIQSLAVIQPAFYSAKPSSSVLDPTDLLLELKSSGSYAQITGAQLISSVAASVSSSRPRNFNAVGNPTFEVDQRNAGTVLTNVVNSAWLQDRYQFAKVGTMTINGGQNAGFVLLPGTNFTISRCFQRITLTTQEASLAAGDMLMFQQSIEGPKFRELISDVHSISLLVRSSVAGLKFGLTIGDIGSATTSLSKLCTIPSANTWSLIQLPNLPVFPAGSWSTGPGLANQYLRIYLSAGTPPSANDVWQGVFNGAAGQSNFAASPVNSTFDISFIQWEPGALCTPPIDCPFTSNYSECLRYYAKSYRYGVKAGAIDSLGVIATTALASNNPWCPIRFPVPMAKVPDPQSYSDITGAAGAVRDVSASIDRGISTFNNVGDSGFTGFGLSSVDTNPAIYTFHYTADTGW